MFYLAINLCFVKHFSAADSSHCFIELSQPKQCTDCFLFLFCIYSCAHLTLIFIYSVSFFASSIHVAFKFNQHDNG